MRKQQSAASKRKAGKGRGTGADYESYISAAEAHSEGTTAEFRDWKTERIVTCLSQGERMFYHILRWNDDVIDIQEQKQLDNDLVDAVIRKLTGDNSIVEPSLLEDNRDPYTADFYVTLKDGSHRAFQVKRNEDQIASLTEQRRIAIEGVYWESLGVPFKLIFADKINPVYVDNIARAVRYYDASDVFDDVSRLQHLVATKQIVLDMKSKPIDWKRLSLSLPELSCSMKGLSTSLKDSETSEGGTEIHG